MGQMLQNTLQYNCQVGKAEKTFIADSECFWLSPPPPHCTYPLPTFLADPGEARGCSINTFVIYCLSEWAFPPIPLRRRHAQTVRDSSSSYKIDYVIVIKTFLNPENHQNRMSGSKVTAILLKGWILPMGGASAVRVCDQQGYPV